MNDMTFPISSTLTYLSPKEVAKLLRKNEHWVYRHAKELGAVKFGGSWIFTLEGINDAIQRRRHMASGSNASEQTIQESGLFNEKGCRKMGKKHKDKPGEILEASRRFGFRDIVD